MPDSRDMLQDACVPLSNRLLRRQWWIHGGDGDDRPHFAPAGVHDNFFFSFLSLSPEISIFVHSLAHLSRLFVSARTVRNTFSSVQFSTLHLFAGFRSPREHYTEKRADAWGGRCSLGRVGHGPPKILVGWATMHLAPPVIGRHVR